jgi:hypothetical protein
MRCMVCQAEVLPTDRRTVPALLYPVAVIVVFLIAAALWTLL